LYRFKQLAMQKDNFKLFWVLLLPCYFLLTHAVALPIAHRAL